MTIYTEGVRVRRGRVLEEFEAPLGDVLGATAEEVLTRSPVSSIARFFELSEAQGEGGDSFFPDMGLPEEPKNLVPKEEAERRAKEAGASGLEFSDGGIPEDALQILIQRKLEERRRQDILNRAPAGFGTASLRIGTALAASMLDPINVAASFIPVIGPARYAKMVKSASSGLGRAGVRARVGLMEGAVGAAVVEPVVLLAATQEQADYDMVDSLMNIGLGSVLGGGLHVGVGAVADAVRGVPRPEGAAAETMAQANHETRAAALRAAVAQMAEGKVVEVENLLRMDPAVSRRQQLLGSTAMRGGADGLRIEGLPRIASEEAPTRQDVVRASLARRMAVGEETTVRAEVQRLEGERTRLEAEMQALLDARRVAREVQAGERDPAVREAVDRVQELQREMDSLDTSTRWGRDRRNRLRKQQDRLIEALPEEQRRVAREITEQRRQESERIAGLSRRLRRVERQIEARSQSLDVAAGAARRAERRFEDIAEQPTREELSAVMRRVREDAQRAQQPESLRVADFEAARIASERYAEIPLNENAQVAQNELDAVLQRVDELAESLGVRDYVGAELAEYDRLIQEAETYQRAVIAAHLCGVRRG